MQICRAFFGYIDGCSETKKMNVKEIAYSKSLSNKTDKNININLHFSVETDYSPRSLCTLNDSYTYNYLFIFFIGRNE